NLVEGVPDGKRTANENYSNICSDGRSDFEKDKHSAAKTAAPVLSANRPKGLVFEFLFSECVRNSWPQVTAALFPPRVPSAMAVASALLRDDEVQPVISGSANVRAAALPGDGVSTASAPGDGVSAASAPGDGVSAASAPGDGVSAASAPGDGVIAA